MSDRWIQVANSVFVPREQVKSIYAYSEDSVVVYCVYEQHHVLPPWTKAIIDELGETVHPTGARQVRGGV